MAESDEQLAAPSKEQLEQEKQLLLAFKPVMQKFLHDHTELQISALYALQVHCNASGLPKGTAPQWSARVRPINQPGRYKPIPSILVMLHAVTR